MSTPTATTTIEVRTCDRRDLAAQWSRWETFLARRRPLPLSYHPAWLAVLESGLRHVPHCLEAVEAEETRGLLPLVLVRGPLFGRFLVGLPYLNYGGVLADDDKTARLLIDHALDLADRLKVRRLVLRHEKVIEHDRLASCPVHKVNVRRPLPTTPEALWKGLGSSVRNQVRKGRKNGLTISWGNEGLLNDFFTVFSRNMRDLGTPVFGRGLFRAIIRQFSDRAEFCIAHAGKTPIAAALLIHGWGITEVPSASSLRQYKSTCANMFMYYHLLERTIERGQEIFDFGRCTPDSPVLRFKQQWGGQAEPAAWQTDIYTVDASDTRPDHPRYQHLVRAWRCLPVPLTRWIGPTIARGIP